LAVNDSIWVVNASPLILLGKLERLDLLNALAQQIIIPRAVADEVAAGADDARFGDLLAWIHPRIATDLPVPPSILGWDLGAGESQVLAHGLAGGYRAVLDDGEARAAAKVHGVALIGTLGVILRARRAKLIPAARPLVERLVSEGSYLGADLVRQALLRVGE
jgi:predicted nucleic acid-binding protein